MKTKTSSAVARQAQEGSAALILETAERLCGERGLESVSIRDIAKETGFSVSVIYHHFGSKANLLLTILKTRMAELGETRAALFAQLEAQPKPELRDILYAILAPTAHLRSDKGGRQATFEFLTRALDSPIPELKEDIDAGVVNVRPVVHLLQRALPHLSHAEVCWRLHFTFGIEHMTHWDDARLAIMSEGKCDGKATEESIERAIAFAEAAFLAPPLSVKTKSSRRKR